MYFCYLRVLYLLHISCCKFVISHLFAQIRILNSISWWTSPYCDMLMLSVVYWSPLRSQSVETLQDSPTHLPIWTSASGRLYNPCSHCNNIKDSALGKEEHETKWRKTRKGGYKDCAYVYVSSMKICEKRQWKVWKKFCSMCCCLSHDFLIATIYIILYVEIFKESSIKWTSLFPIWRTSQPILLYILYLNEAGQLLRLLNLSTLEQC